MKQTILVVFAYIFSICVATAQKQPSSNLVTDSFAVNGNCGMCKTTIEKAAKKAGASIANWSEEKHILVVAFDTEKTSIKKMQEQIAKVGYDNAGATSTDAAYNKLHGCCQYERVPMIKKEKN